MPKFNLQTADGMLAFCEYYEMGAGFSKKWALKHLNLIIDTLRPNEQVLTVFIGIYNYKSISKHGNNAAYAVTTDRIVIAQQNLVGKSISSVSIDHINDIKLNTGFMGGTVTFDALTETFNVFLNKEIAERVFKHSRDCIKYAKDKKKEAASTSLSKSSNLSEIRELKNLYDDGIISLDEFEAKKKQLLGI